jgi:pimeloyl-ACP methyl ester carboxylesterase
LALVGLALTSLGAPASATDAFDPAAATLRQTSRWAKTERLEDPHPKLKGDRHNQWTRHTDPELVAAFGDAAPDSSVFLLHYARGWDAATRPTPVLLVHGAGLTANHCYADRPIQQPYPGLAAHLTQAGRAVFALTFAHGHGDNLKQAELLADAIARVRHVTGAEQVDLVAHSKGGMACRIYLSDAGPAWATRYRGDVRRYVMLGTPNGGIDVSFAYPNLNYWILENKSSAPLSWTEGLYYGKWVEFADRALTSGCYPGQLQMVARWDGRYGHTRAKGQLDVPSTYVGGRGQVSVAIGIDAAIAAGGGLMARLAKKGIHPKVELAVLAGSSPWILHLIGERRGPSDGLLLVESAFATDALTQRGAKLLRKDLRSLNHLQLVYDPRANAWVEEVLAQ